MAAPALSSSANVLNSWKEIASYLGRGVRTVQRYERELALPVRRPRGTSRSAVIALKEDLDAWLRKAPSSELQHLPRPARAQHLVTAVRQSITQSDELRHRCSALREAHHQLISKLIANLNGLVDEVQITDGRKPLPGAAQPGQRSTELI